MMSSRSDILVQRVKKGMSKRIIIGENASCHTSRDFYLINRIIVAPYFGKVVNMKKSSAELRK
jgi:hypothetical protein